ncbi:ABC transporter permease [Pedobacter sp. SYSU D00535]|uniref:ABC transporter permease n=1 Tax=Pedobacter sp. SYSU D00535 TaxID=2810308 RepID=UPI001F61817A|nr:FtsX-like permease family protein [Pedobacter sp. SYSU D00535]
MNFSMNVLLVAFGTSILTLLLLSSEQFKSKLSNNSRNIDLVVGAKGSPMQLILSSVYYVDFPTGNIPLKEANKLAAHPMVERAVPLALGDNYEGFRMAGTDSNFVILYGLELKEGKFWKAPFEVTVGSEVARNQGLQVGDVIHGAHGLSSSQDLHAERGYTVTGILKRKGNVTDNLVLTSVESIWNMHGGHDEEQDKELTALLIKYSSPMAVVMFPRMVNQTTAMQAASPAFESARLFTLTGIGMEVLRWFAILIMLIAGASIFISLYSSLQERKYDLAVMRVMGSSQEKIFLIVMMEGVLLTLIGSLVGVFLGHLSLQVVSHYQEMGQTRFEPWIFMKEEFLVLGGGLCLGLLASAIPAVQAYRSDISLILATH